MDPANRVAQRYSRPTKQGAFSDTSDPRPPAEREPQRYEQAQDQERLGGASDAEQAELHPAAEGNEDQTHDVSRDEHIDGERDEREGLRRRGAIRGGRGRTRRLTRRAWGEHGRGPIIVKLPPGQPEASLTPVLDFAVDSGARTPLLEGQSELVSRKQVGVQLLGCASIARSEALRVALEV